jgi:hypothetical protein
VTKDTEDGSEEIVQAQPERRTAGMRFAHFLMERDRKSQEKESNLEAMIRLNLMVSFLTLGVVGGFETVRMAISLIPYL